MNERMSVQRKKRTNIESALQAPTHDEAHTTAAAPQIVQEVLGASGQPLDEQTRAFMEPRFGHDFSRVRVHTDDRAAESAEAVNALAYTVGQDIVFGAGRYAPSSAEGQRLLAHELTHVVQQQSGSLVGSRVESELSAPGEAAEQEAEEVAAVASRVVLGEPMQVQTPSGATIARKEDPEKKDDASDQLLGGLGDLLKTLGEAGGGTSADIASILGSAFTGASGAQKGMEGNPLGWFKILSAIGEGLGIPYAEFASDEIDATMGLKEGVEGSPVGWAKLLAREGLAMARLGGFDLAEVGNLGLSELGTAELGTTGFLGPIAAVGASGVAGYEVGQGLDKAFGLSDSMSSGAFMLERAIAGDWSEVDRMSDLAGKGESGMLAKLGDNLGDWVFDLLHKDK